MSRFICIATPFSGLAVLQRQPMHDERGFFERLFCENDLAELLQGSGIRQINHSCTALQGIVRGMHYQLPPHTEKKIVSCLRGKIWDVAVDVRYGSPTFLRWHGEILSEENHRSLFIPEGFAHGFQTLTGDCAMIYMHSAQFVKDAEAALNPCDPRLAIDWPLPVSGLSPRDEAHPMIGEGFTGQRL